MTEEQFRREKMYQATLALVRFMFSKGLITAEEMRRIDTILLEKYKPVLGCLRAYKP